MTKSGFDIDEIARLLAGEETSGPWWNEGCEIFYLNDSGQRCTLIYGEGGHGEHDAALIVTLHNSAPAMLTEIRELRAENARLKKLTIPTWFYHPDYPEYCKFDPSEVIDEDYDPLPGDHVFEIDCAVALPSIWCAVHVSNDPDADERFTHTEHASEAEARAALGEPQ